MGNEQRVEEIAREVGFDLVGIAPLRPPRDAQRFDAWLGRGLHAGLKYLERERERILDPRRILPSGKSLLIVGLAHSRAAIELQGGGRVARYAAGRDYHNLVLKRLRRLRKRLKQEGLVRDGRAIVDAGPLLERSHAAEAGLGFLSKAANLLHPRFGPWFFLGELLLDLELSPTESPLAGSCGTCTACIDACPTGAILEPGSVDAGRCISYHTIENPGHVPDELRPRMGTWAFGCDVCSEVCPWGGRAPDLAQRFGTHPAISDHGLVAWLETGERFAERFAGSTLLRPKRSGIARNAAIALGNLPSDDGRRALLKALSFDPSAVVREAAAWSLSTAHARDAGVREALERAATLESAPEFRQRVRFHRQRAD